MSNSIFYEELSPTELQQIIKNSGIIYFPIGTLEWHSKHLPFGLDALVSYELCKKACLKTGGCIIPPLYFGTDREHNSNGKILRGMDAKAGEKLPGSLYFIKPELLLDLLKQIVKNVNEQGFKKMIIVSAHSGTAQQNTLETLAKEKFGDLKLFVLPGKLFEGGIDHAGPIETSLMMAINRSLVHMDRISEPMGPIIGTDVDRASEQEGKDRIEKIVKQIATTLQG